MKKSKLIEVFTCLEKKDLRDLGKFVSSPFFNQQPQIVQFYNYLYESIIDLKLIPEKEKIFKKIYPGEAYNDVKIRLLMTFMASTVLQDLLRTCRTLPKAPMPMISNNEPIPPGREPSVGSSVGCVVGSMLSTTSGGSASDGSGFVHTRTESDEAATTSATIANAASSPI